MYGLPQAGLLANDFIGYETVNVNNNSEYTGDLAR